MLVVFIFAVFCETKDIQMYEGKFKEGQGLTYRTGIFKEGDTLKDSLDKIKKTNGYNIKDIQWRKAYIIAFVITVVIYAVIFNRIPPGSEFASVFFIAFIGIFAPVHYYNYHHHRYPVANVNKHLENINNIIQENNINVNLHSNKTKEFEKYEIV